VEASEVRFPAKRLGIPRSGHEGQTQLDSVFSDCAVHLVVFRRTRDLAISETTHTG
jgi:hypothetical protein